MQCAQCALLARGLLVAVPVLRERIKSMFNNTDYAVATNDQVHCNVTNIRCRKVTFTNALAED